MYNQEQLAAIAAAMSFLQQTMQSNPTSNVPPQLSSATATTTISSSTPNNGNHDQLANLQQQLAAITAAAAATVTQQQQQSPMHQRNDDHNHIQRQPQLQQHLSNSLFDNLQQNPLNGLASLASLEAALPPANDHHQMQQISARQMASIAASVQTPTTITTTSQHPLLDGFQAQFNQMDLNLTPPSPNQPLTQLRLEDREQILLNQLQAIRQQQDLQQLINLPPQQQQHLLEQYQAKLEEQQLRQSDISNVDPLSLKQARAMTMTDQRPQQSQSEQDQPQLINSDQQTPKVAKQTRPISYSAVVAKSAGLTANHSASVNAGTSDTSKGVNNNNNNNNNDFNVSQSNFGGLVSSNNALGDGPNHSNIMLNSISPFARANIHSIAGDSDPTYKFNGTGGVHSRSLRASQLHMTATNSVVSDSLNNHIPNSTNYDIFNTNNVTGNSLSQTNGSTLLKHQNSKNLLLIEPNLDSYITDHPNLPARQSFNNQQSNFYRQNQMPTRMNYQQQQQQQQSNNHSIGNSDIIINTNSRDKSALAYGRATNLLGFMGLYVGNLSPDLSKEQLEKIFSKYGEPVKAHRLVRSPVAFIKYENTESPRAAIDDLYNILLPELTLNPDQPLKLHFDRNDAQLKANYRPTDLPKEDNGECYGWRTTVCKRGKSCPKKHIPINRGIDFQMWMIKTNSTSATSIINPNSATLTS